MRHADRKAIQHRGTGAKFRGMPRFYFNVCCDGFEATDTVGEHCRDALAARFEAMRAARIMIRQQLVTGDLPKHGWIEVEDEHHRPLMKVPLRSAAY